jgi:O-antigen ligase
MAGPSRQIGQDSERGHCTEARRRTNQESVFYRTQKAGFVVNITVHRVTKIGTVGERDLKPGFPAKSTYIAIPVARIPTAVRWCFLSFVCTLPFEATELPFVTGSLSLAKLSGLLFFLFYFLYYGPFSTKRSFPYPSRAVWWFLGYIVVFVLNGLFAGEEFVSDFLTRCFTQVQLVVLLWIASDLLKDEKMARSVLLTFSIASGLLAVGNILQLPGFYEEVSAGRVTAFDYNQNLIAVNMAFAAVMAVGLCLYTSYRIFPSKILLFVLTLCLLVVMVRTGSRGGVAGFMIGSLVYLLPYWRSKRTWIAIVLVILSVAAVLYITAGDPAVLERWRQTYYEGDLAGRDEIYAIVSDMILEKPVLGWSIPGNYELGRREGGRFFSIARDAHNTPLALLLDVGIVGATPFFVGLWLCGLSAWRARLGSLGLLPLALLFTLVVCMMSGNFVPMKQLWLILALTLAAAPAMSRELEKQFPALLRISSSKVAAKRLDMS